MKIESVEFVISAGHEQECPESDLVEIAMSGRSNVGKSSLLNSLFGRKRMAKVSNTPGKTQRLNFFRVNDAFHLVDLPGYGYAEASAKSRTRWGRMMQSYLQGRQQLQAMVQLVDSRHAPSREDREMVQWLRDEQMPFCLVATKIDKLGLMKRAPALRTILDTLELPATQALVAYSSETGEGKPALLSWIGKTLEAVSAD